MKRYFHVLRAGLCCFLLTACLASIAQAQSTNVWEQQLPVLKPRNSYLSEVGPHSRTWTLLPEKANRQAMEIANPQGRGQRHVEELETGMNYYDGTQWVPSEAKFELVGDSFLANKVQHKINIAAEDINVGNAVEIAVPGGGLIQSTPVAIGLYDTVSGESMIIGQLTNCPGAMLSSNRVVFENAFSGVCADIVYTIEKGAFAQDVVITGRINPQDYGFSTNTTRIQIFTEVYNDVRPQLTRRPIQIEEDDRRRSRMASPDVIDNSIAVGELFFGLGRAYVGNALNVVDSGALVTKDWVEVEGRRFLVESVEYSAVSDQIQTLPECNPVPSMDGASIQSLRKPLRKVYASIPQKALERQKLHASNTKTRNLASVRTGLVVDYQLSLVGGSGKTFSSDVTYIVSGSVTCSSATVFEGGTCLKYTTNGSVLINGSVVCKGATYSPIVFTAVDDHSVGDVVSVNTTILTNGYANPALYFSYASNPGITNAMFRYCKVAIRSDVTPSSGVAVKINDSQIINCLQAVSIVVGSASGSSSGSSPVTASINDTLIANGSSFPTMTSVLNVSGLGSGVAFTGTLLHDTIVGAQAVGTVNYSSSSLLFTNSILAGVGNVYSGKPVSVGGGYNGFYSYGTGQPFGTAYVTAGATPFVDANNLNCYLADASSFRSLGTTNGLTTLLAGFANRSAYAPRVLTNINGSISLAPSVPRYSSGSPDLGYYHPALDYVAGGLSATNGSTVTVQPGTAIGLNSHMTAFRLMAGVVWTSIGTPTQPIHYAPTALVQANPAPQTSPAYTIAFAPDYQSGSGAAVPYLKFRFSNFYLGCNDYHIGSGTNAISGTNTALSLSSCMNLTFQDSVLHGGKLGLGVMNASITDPGTSRIGWTNNLFERVYIGLVASNINYPVYAYNNLFYRGILKLAPTNGWAFHDNLFDEVVFNQTRTNTVDWDYNVFSTATAGQLAAVTNTDWVTSGTALPNTNGASSTYTTTLPSYASQTLGAYYFTPSASFYTTYLKDKGSRTSDTAGLYDFTMTTSNERETNSVVDIGFHYVSTTSGKPMDTDGDGMPDYLEDTNGNGTYDSAVDLSNRNAMDTDGDGMSDYTEWLQGRNIKTGVSSDVNNLINLRVFSPLK